MKLSDMSADHLFDTLGVAGEELGAIFEDTDLVGKIEKINDQGPDESLSAFGLRRAKDVLSVIGSLAKTHRVAVYRIVGEFKKISAEEVGKLSVPELWDQLRESLNDELFLSFFPQLRPWVGKSLSDMLSKPDPARPEPSYDTSLIDTEPTFSESIEEQN